MANLTLRDEDRTVRTYPLALMTTIGRLSDNAVVIDSPAVSSHHACVFRDGNDFIIEDLQSTNGTFVNDARVTRQALQNGDVVAVGKHTLVFDGRSQEASTAAAAEGHASSIGETVFLDVKQNQRLLGIVMNAEARAKQAQAIPSRVGKLRVIDGPSDREEYLLEGHTSLIGRAGWTLVRLKGWFKPGVAVAITRNHQGYVATRLRGKMLINDQAAHGRHELKEGDVLQVGGLTLAFHFVDRSQAAADPSSAPVPSQAPTEHVGALAQQPDAIM